MRADPILVAGRAAPARGNYDWRGLALLMLAAAVLLRSALFGNALFGQDEQFYLLVGDRMLDGAVPYVDIWDRKPYGLFVLFAGIRALGGPPFLVAEVVAALFAGATAFVVAVIAARRVAIGPAAMAGIFYLLTIGMLGGDVTQASVFYNLPVAVAAWLALATGATLDRRGDMARVLAAMLLCGIAIQIKTNAAFEGAAIGLFVLSRMWGRMPMIRIAARAATFAAVGIAPTTAVALGFALAGHFDAWWFANVQSQFLKTGGWSDEAIVRLGGLLAQTAASVALAAIGLVLMQNHAERRLFAIWAILALVDMVAIGNFWLHYAIPFALPASILAATMFALPRHGMLAFALLSCWPALDALVLDRIFAAETGKVEAATLAAIPADVRSNCLFAYNAPAAYYVLTDACLVTPYVFVDHLRSAAEAKALPEDATVALRAALARRPGTILSVEVSHWERPNCANDAIVAAALRRDYRPIARIPLYTWPLAPETLIVWRRDDLPTGLRGG